MKQEIRDQILSVLNDYNYGHGALRQLRGGQLHHCILGVIYEEFKKVHKKTFRWSNFSQKGRVLFFIREQDQQKAKFFVCRWAGLTEHEYSLLAVANDVSKQFPVVTLRNL